MDAFVEPTKRLLASRVGHRCSLPDCRAQTVGPSAEQAKSVNVGVAAHITAASPGGPRFDVSLSAEARSSEGNGIWLCQTCAALIDRDVDRFIVR